MGKKTITIEVPEGKSAQWLNGVLTLVDDTPKDIRERVKTLEDAINLLGEAHPLVEEYEALISELGDSISPDIKAYNELRIIVAALNEGWTPSFDGIEWRWYPWYKLVSDSDIADMSEEGKSRVVRRSGNDADADGGVVYAVASYDASYVSAHLGARLALKSENLAIYAGTQFKEYYARFIFAE